jgi:S-adenosylmethionine:tRNA ribosyltransferase-isomerase
MLVSEFDYDLPPSCIAQFPVEPRDASKLLVLNRDSGVIEHSTFRDLCDRVKPGDLFVLNNTRVSARRLHGTKSTGGHVEALLLRRVSEVSYEALLKPNKRLPNGARLIFGDHIQAEVRGNTSDGLRMLEFETQEDLEEAISNLSVIPLPPYIHESLEDESRYQSIYAEVDGSAAAPTAGLHFTPDLMNRIRAIGGDFAWVSLNISFDTFRPIRTHTLEEHDMHGERYCVPKDTVAKIEQCQGRVFAVGTTVVRTLESAAIGHRRLKSGARETHLFIHPGFEFKVIDCMITNFHMPRSTLLVLLSAFCGKDKLLRAYEAAINSGYRFLSFGDAMLIV